MELYKKESVNPASGCLPILVQIPVFFSLYKVLFVTIEMRHAPFFGWIRDLSAPDPTSVFNLFGLLPFDPATVPVVGHFLTIGAWPVIMERRVCGALPADRRLALDHGRDHVGADEAQPGAARSSAGQGVRLDAGVLHLLAGGLHRRGRRVLDVEH